MLGRRFAMASVLMLVWACGGEGLPGNSVFRDDEGSAVPAEAEGDFSPDSEASSPNETAGQAFGDEGDETTSNPGDSEPEGAEEERAAGGTSGSDGPALGPGAGVDPSTPNLGNPLPGDEGPSGRDDANEEPEGPPAGANVPSDSSESDCPGPDVPPAEDTQPECQGDEPQAPGSGSSCPEDNRGNEENGESCPNSGNGCPNNEPETENEGPPCGDGICEGLEPYYCEADCY